MTLGNVTGIIRSHRVDNKCSLFSVEFIAKAEREKSDRAIANMDHAIFLSLEEKTMLL